MSYVNRIRRSVRRGIKSEGLWAKRSRKADLEYMRWYNGMRNMKYVDAEGHTVWVHMRLTPPLIHKGRKP